MDGGGGGVSKYHGYGVQNTMDRRSKYHGSGVRYTMGRRVTIPWIGNLELVEHYERSGQRYWLR